MRNWTQMREEDKAKIMTLYVVLIGALALFVPDETHSFAQFLKQFGGLIWTGVAGFVAANLIVLFFEPDPTRKRIFRL